jgi:hypothetical protein
MNRLAKFVRLPPADRRLLIEASLLLLAARAILWLLPFRTLARLISQPPAASPPGDDETRALAHRVGWAVRLGARTNPGRTVCFPQGIAAQLMLARRGVAGTLYYGVAKSGDGALEAHVWVRAGALPVVGCGAAPRFTLLTTFPREAA